jgi:hypothetical protein
VARGARGEGERVSQRPREGREMPKNSLLGALQQKKKNKNKKTNKQKKINKKESRKERKKGKNYKKEKQK